MESKLKSVFLPPGVQVKLSERLGTIPRQLPPVAVAQIDALWMRRNQCQESEIDGIDAQMEQIAGSATQAQSKADAAPAKAQIIDGHPVPYSLTVQVNGESVKDASAYLEIVDAFLRAKGMHRTRTEGAYVHYDAALTSAESAVLLALKAIVATFEQPGWTGTRIMQVQRDTVIKEARAAITLVEK